MTAIAPQQLELLYDVSRSLHALIELDTLLPVVTEKTKTILDAEGCSVILLDEAGTSLYFPWISPESPEVAERLRTLRMPADQGIAGTVVQTGHSLLVPDVRADPRFYSQMDEQTGGATRSIMAAPLRTQHGIIGVIECINKCHGEFTPDELTFLEALAAPIAVSIDNARLYETLRRSEAALRDEVAVLERERPVRTRFTDIVGTGDAMDTVFQLMESAITSPITVLLQGETGTGKEIIARAIHFEGPRKAKPFVAVNCGAFTETLLDSELFGYRKGAFTGATADKRGLFEAADGGTIFLDEIGDTPPALQVKLLRVLERGELMPVGDTQVRTVNTRIISASHKDLLDEVRTGRFRQDLYYRVSAFPIHVPPLRARCEDIPLLVAFLLKRLAEKWERPGVTVAPAAMDALLRYPWPGNVRELEHELERAVTLAGPSTILDTFHFSERIVQAAARAQPRASGSLRQARAAFEKGYIADTLRAHNGNVSHAARALGISRVMLQKKMKALGLRAPATP